MPMRMLENIIAQNNEDLRSDCCCCYHYYYFNKLFFFSDVPIISSDLFFLSNGSQCFRIKIPYNKIIKGAQRL